MYILYSFFWFVSSTGNVGMASHNVVANLTKDQCYEMKEYVIGQFEKEGLKKDNKDNFLSASSDFTVECKKIGD